MNATAALPLLLRVSDAAAYLGLSKTEFQRRDRHGKIPAPVQGPAGSYKAWSRLELEDWTRAGCPPRAAWDQAKRRTA